MSRSTFKNNILQPVLSSKNQSAAVSQIRETSSVERAQPRDISQIDATRTDVLSDDFRNFPQIELSPGKGTSKTND
jgi:hypothetical protein